jgi:hypothetical protein
MGGRLRTFNREQSARQAIRTLRAIRQRYEDGRAAHPEVPSFSVQVALSLADMLWLTAAIEVLEEVIPEDAAGAPGAAGPENVG